jgi:hypothetical protein
MVDVWLASRGPCLNPMAGDAGWQCRWQARCQPPSIATAPPAAEKRQRALDVAELLGLTDALDGLVGSAIIKGISGGEKRRWARALLAVLQACPSARPACRTGARQRLRLGSSAAPPGGGAAAPAGGQAGPSATPPPAAGPHAAAG